MKKLIIFIILLIEACSCKHQEKTVYFIPPKQQYPYFHEHGIAQPLPSFTPHYTPNREDIHSFHLIENYSMLYEKKHNTLDSKKKRKQELISSIILTMFIWLIVEISK
jgi:hypothetical protein